MKKIYVTLSLLLVATMGFSQGVQRMMLVEEFTNASCGPCAGANPAFNAMLSQNAGKVAKIKYQTNWPGADPMNAQTQTNVAPRVTYYAVQGVPHAVGDGNYISDHPANWTQGTIDGRYPVLSPLTVTTSHIISADLDSIYISVLITPAVSVAASGPGKLKLRVAMTESTIGFASPPGSNGETEFFEVMRDMYPNAAGTVLPDALTMGMPQVFTFAKAIPAYVYDKSEIGVVSFVQDDGTKEVLQASFSDIVPFSIDSKAISLSVPSFICGQATTNASLTMKNVGMNTMTACNVEISIDGTLALTQPWSGSVAPAQSTTITLNNIPATSGSHALSINCVQIGDVNLVNDDASASFGVASAPQMLPIAENVEAAIFPPINWATEDVDNDATGWGRTTGASGFGASAACMFMNFYNSPAGSIDNLYLPKLNLATAATARITMNRAYAQYQAENDAIKIQYSTDCGATWNTIWSKSGTAMTTAPATTSPFVPTAAQWAKDTAYFGAACGQADVLVRFNAVSAYGNMALVDDINIEVLTTVGIEAAKNIADFKVYPNPANNVANVSFNLTNASEVTVEVFNTNGQSVYTAAQGKMNAGTQAVSINTQNFATGVYMVNVSTNGQSISQLLNVSK